MQQSLRGILYSCIILMVCGVMLSCQGPAGQDGKDGLDGKDGNANVTSTTFTFVSTDLTRTFSDDRVYGLERTISNITSDIVNRGVVIVYLRSTNISWQPLPATEPGFGINAAYIFSANTLRIDFRVSSGNARTILASWLPGTSYSVRVITIPATTVTVALKGVDVRNHDAVVSALGLKGVE